MRGWRRAGLWFYLLQKRLCRKKIFLLILIFIPTAVLLLSAAVQEKSGVIKVLLCAEDEDDTLASEMIDRIVHEKSILLFEKETSTDAAYERVGRKEADAAWIFHKDFEKRLKEYSKNRKKRDVITIVTSRDSPFLELAAEKVFGAVFPRLSYDIYVSFLEEKKIASSMTEKEFQEYYAATHVEGSLFQFVYADYEDATAELEEQNYLMTPVRGLLSLFVLLCGISASLFYMKDEKKGIFNYIPVEHSYLLALGYHAAAVLDGALAALAALYFFGNFTEIWRETIMMGAYGMLVTVFCNAARILSRKQECLGPMIPMLILISLVVCPVFLNIKQFKTISYLLPPTYYLNGFHDIEIFWKMLGYSILLGTAGYVLSRRRDKM